MGRGEKENLSWGRDSGAGTQSGMPHWCFNYVEISQRDPEKLITPSLEEIEMRVREGTVCAELFPDTSLSYSLPRQSYYSSPLENNEISWDQIKASNPTYKDGTLSFFFDTAWIPPTPIYNCLDDLGYNVLATYYEPEMEFCGVWDRGTETTYQVFDETEDFYTDDPDGVLLNSHYNLLEIVQEHNDAYSSDPDDDSSHPPYDSEDEYHENYLNILFDTDDSEAETVEYDT